MNDWFLAVGALGVLTTLFGCDLDSKEIGATIGGESSGTATGLGTSGGVGESSGAVESGCAAVADEDACVAHQTGSQSECVWVDVQTTDATCSFEGETQGRCIELRFFGDGCTQVTPCVDQTSVYTRELETGGFESFPYPAQCGYDLVGFSDCKYDGSEEAPCGCLCQGLGGIGSVDCDPLVGPPCPGTPAAPWECVPTPQNDAWECIPQEGDPLGYGDECSLEQPYLACLRGTTCLPPEGLGIAECDGGDGAGCCAQLCSLTEEDASCPDEGQICSPFYGEAEPPEGYEDLGVCRLPS